jgi:hypothetical protein
MNPASSNAGWSMPAREDVITTVLAKNIFTPEI